LGKNKKKKEKQEGQPPQVTTRRLNPNEILQQANSLKDRFSSTKGKADQMISDAVSSSMQGMLNMINNLLRERAEDEAKIVELKKQVEELTPKGSKKKIPEPEKPK